jgi:hypothetical protein
MGHAACPASRLSRFLSQHTILSANATPAVAAARLPERY